MYLPIFQQSPAVLTHTIWADISRDLDLRPLDDPSHPEIPRAIPLGGAYLPIRDLREEETVLWPIAMPLPAAATADREELAARCCRGSRRDGDGLDTLTWRDVELHSSKCRRYDEIFSGLRLIFAACWGSESLSVDALFLCLSSLGAGGGGLDVESWAEKCCSLALSSPFLYSKPSPKREPAPLECRTSTPHSARHATEPSTRGPPGD